MAGTPRRLWVSVHCFEWSRSVGASEIADVVRFPLAAASSRRAGLGGSYPPEPAHRETSAMAGRNRHGGCARIGLEEGVSHAVRKSRITVGLAAVHRALAQE